MNAGREAAAKRMIRHYPDVALETLRTEAIHTPASASMRVVALAYDEQAGSGLAYLSSGAEAEGLRWLDAARKTFAAAGLDAPLRQCMANEIRYLDQKGKTSEAQALRDQLQALGK